MYRVYPHPKETNFRDDFFYKSKQSRIFFTEDLVNVFSVLEEFLKYDKSEDKNADILYNRVEGLGEEAYKILITEHKIYIEYTHQAGAYYATQTLKQIYQQTNDKIRALEIFDEPDLPTRGFMMDISRDKIPTMKTIYEIIDMMGLLKMNHFELYVEGFSYGYPSFSRYWEDETPITVEEYQEIERYCQSKHIDLVPNQNGFGHMAPWLALEEFSDLAECPEGIHLWGTHRVPSTLDPLNPKSLELIKQMYADMLPYSKSQYFNMNFDEPFELGKGKSKEYCKEHGLGNCYVDFVLKAYEEIKKYNKTPLIWGDVLLKHPEVLDRLPKDMIFIDWGYDGNYPFSKNLKIISQQNIKFMAAPGTTSWCSLAGRTMDMLMNIYNACLYTKKYNGQGVLLTDWGDFGHLQYWPISLIPLSFFGNLSWRVDEGTYFNLKHFVNKHVFKDSNNIMADLMLDFGSYNKFENGYMSNGTQTFYSLIWSNFALKEEDPLQYFEERIKHSKFSILQFELLQKHFDDILTRLELVDMNRNDNNLIKEEIKQSVLLLRTIQKINLSFNEEINIDKRINYLKEAIDSKELLIKKHHELWLQRNKTGGLLRSSQVIEKLIYFANIKFKELIIRGEEDEVEI